MSDEEDRFNNSDPKKIWPDEPKHFSHSDWQICFNKAEIFRLNASPHPAEKNGIRKWPAKLCFVKRNSFISSDPYNIFFSARGVCTHSTHPLQPADLIYTFCLLTMTICVCGSRTIQSQWQPPKKKSLHNSER